MAIAHHALVLNLHQPPGNLQDLLEHQTWEAKEILFALDRIPRSLWGREELARVHLSLSGTLLETLSDPLFQERVYGIVDCGALLWHLQNQALFEVVGTGYFHPVLPLIPEADRREHLGAGSTSPVICCGVRASRASGRPRWGSRWNSSRCCAPSAIAMSSSTASMSSRSTR
jgi:hypothetical protein